MSSPFRTHRGFAVILVLFACALCTLILVILMERVSISTKSTASYTHSAQLRSLSEMAVNVVQAQVRDATTTNQTTSTLLPNRDTWASQPGAIRTYRNSGGLRLIYKLYSSGTMQTSVTNLGQDVPSDWADRPSEYTDLNDPVRVDSNVFYPVVSPGVHALNSSANGITEGFSINGAPVDPLNPSANTVPMPIRWIYVLEDGTLCQLGDNRISGTTNPIIGRIAFWTDDETSKVNLNTASPTTSNSYWDIPRAKSSFESRYGWNQPAQNEYQRYPGHPAMVSLRPILGNLSHPGEPSGISNDGFYRMTPHYQWGGSEDGTMRIDASRTSLLTNKQDRLYTTVDELLFSGSSSALRMAPSPDQVESLKFFLTTSSRAPELNLFGQPRVTIWPIHAVDAPTRRTPYDQLIAFCSTIAAKPYYFTRADPLSMTSDYADIPRNQSLYSYLQNLTNTPIPGFGGPSFSTKYGTDRDQILTEIFDYIRCTNLNETYQGRDPGFVSYTPDWARAIQTTSYTATSPEKGAGFVVPIRIGSTKGGGRFPTVTGVGLWFIRHLQTPGQPPGAANPEQLSAMLALKTCTPMFGFMPWIGSNLRFEISNADVKAMIGSTQSNLFTSGTSKEIYYPPLVGGKDGTTPGGYEGFTWPLGIENLPATTPPTPFFSQAIPVGSGNNTFSIVGGSVDITMTVRGDAIQTFRATFPSVNDITLPSIDAGDFRNNDGSNGFTSAFPWWQSRMWNSPNGPWAGDVLKSIELKHGDARLALMSVTDANAPYQDFEPHPDYSTPAAFTHSFRGFASFPFLVQNGNAGSYVNLPHHETSFTMGGKLVKASYRPDITPAINDLIGRTWSGDFDNGMGNFPDGPFLNKPDEGTSAWGATEIPYDYAFWVIGNGLFSPLRQVPSPAMFGSLPTGVKAGIPWRTLLFCPNPRDSGHKGFETPRDHLLLDLFRMPVVEPHAMSGPASTDGKINMNYAIAPFTYIRRASSWYALLETLKMMAIPDGQSANYKGSGSLLDMRHPINVAETLSQFDTRFSNGEIFRSATEICDLFLVPKTGTVTLANIQNLNSGFWPIHRPTGDNTREKPYAELYSKLTTQSNTFLVHMRVQILPKTGTLPTNKKDFEPVAEYRGSRLIERYLNPGKPSLLAIDPDNVCKTRN